MFEPLLTESQAELREAVRDFTRREIIPLAMSFDERAEPPQEIYRAFFETGLLHAYVPCAYGGRGHDATTTMLIAEELAYGCLATASALVVGILPLSMVIAGASDALKERLLRPLSQRFSLPAIACTELGAGSDLRATQTRAVRRASEYEITGEKAYVSNLPFAEFVVVVARTEPGEKLGSGRSLSAFALPVGLKGMTPGPRRQTLGLRSLAVCSLSLNRVVVPEEWRIGDEGDGLALLNGALDLSRIMMAGYATGACRRVVAELLDLGRKRGPDGTKPSHDQAYRFALVRLEEEVQAARALAWLAAERHDAGMPYTRQASLAKLHAGRVCRLVGREAQLMLGDQRTSATAVVEKFQREVPAISIIEGPEPIQSEIIYADMLRRR